MALDSSLELTGLVKRYGDTTAVDGIDLKIASGSYCCLLGPSGCGKTSTLRMIAGHEFATDGRVLLGGKDITRNAAADRGTAMMFQSYALFPHLSVLDNVAFSWKMRGKGQAERQARARELLARLGPHKLGKACLYFKRLADLDLAVLEALVSASVAEVKRRHPPGSAA